MLAQLPTLAPGQLENWLISAAAALSVAALVKKLLPQKRRDSDLVTREELHHELNTIRDRLDALSEKIERALSALHDRLSSLEAAVARLDERSRHS
jgi:hypothetical protein